MTIKADVMHLTTDEEMKLREDLFDVLMKYGHLPPQHFVGMVANFIGVVKSIAEDSGLPNDNFDEVLRKNIEYGYTQYVSDKNLRPN